MNRMINEQENKFKFKLVILRNKLYFTGKLKIGSELHKRINHLLDNGSEKDISEFLILQKLQS